LSLHQHCICTDIIGSYSPGGNSFVFNWTFMSGWELSFTLAIYCSSSRRTSLSSVFRWVDGWGMYRLPSLRHFPNISRRPVSISLFGESHWLAWRPAPVSLASSYYDLFWACARGPSQRALWLSTRCFILAVSRRHDLDIGVSIYHSPTWDVYWSRLLVLMNGTGNRGSVKSLFYTNLI
jgi:hypothetical protein